MSPTLKDKERKAFEAWRRRTTKMDPDAAVALRGMGSDADYENTHTRSMFMGWIGRALRTEPAALSPKSSMGTEPSDEREAFEAWYAGGHPVPPKATWFKRDPDEPEDYDSVEMHWLWKCWKARAVLALAAPAVQVHQFRKVGCSDWYDGLPDREDGRGPYETRTLYAAPAVQHKTLETMAAEAALEQDPELGAPAVQAEPKATELFSTKECPCPNGPADELCCAKMRILREPTAQSADAVDAKRYRWLRGHWLKLVAVTGRESIDMRAGDEASIDDEEDGCRLDAAIDAALQSAAHPEGGDA